MSRRALLLAIVLAAAATYLCVVARYLGSPLRFDETEWPGQSQAIARRGVPKILYSEDKQLWLSPFLGLDAHYGMWHPPVYQYSLALGGIVLGWSDAAMRGVSLLWFAATMLLAWGILGSILPRGTPALVRVLPLALVLLTPLVADGSLHLDIDNTSLAFFLLLFSYVFLREPLDTSWRRCLELGLLVALALWSKLTSPFLLLGAATLYLFLSRRFLGGLRLAAVGSTVGFGLFLSTYLLFCRLMSYPPMFMFNHSYLHNRKIYQPNQLWPILQSLRWHTIWISPGISLLLLLVLGVRARRYLRERRTEPADFLLISAAMIFFFYAAWGGLFGKYTVPGVILGLLGAAPQLAAAFEDLRIERPRAWLGLCAALLAACLLLPALQIRPPRAAAGSLPWRESLLDPRNFVLLAVLVLLALFVWASRRLGPALLAGLVAYIAIANPVSSLKVVLPGGYDRSPYRPFLDRGFAATAADLNTLYGPSAVIIAPKDMGYYFAGRHYPMETVAAFQGLPALRPLIEEGKVSAVVDDLAYPTLNDEATLQVLGRKATPVRHGDFVIWRLR